MNVYYRNLLSYHTMVRYMIRNMEQNMNTSRRPWHVASTNYYTKHFSGLTVIMILFRVPVKVRKKLKRAGAGRRPIL